MSTRRTVQRVSQLPMRGAVLGAATVVVLLAASACRDGGEVSLDFRRREPPAPEAVRDETSLRMAVGAMIGPEPTYRFYAELMSHLAGKVGRRAEMVQRRTYEEVNRMLLDGEVDIALVCTGAYVVIRDRVRLLAVPVSNGSPTYYSLILVRRNGPATLEELRGTRFGFTDPLSNTGRMYPLYLLRERFGEGPREFFGRVFYTGGHDESIRQLLRGTLDAVAVDNLVYEKYAEDRPQEVADVVVLHRSPPFGAPPFIARTDLEPAIADGVQEALLGLDTDPTGRSLLQVIGVDRFTREADYSLAIAVAETALASGPDMPAPHLRDVTRP